MLLPIPALAPVVERVEAAVRLAQAPRTPRAREWVPSGCTSVLTRATAPPGRMSASRRSSVASRSIQWKARAMVTRSSGASSSGAYFERRPATAPFERRRRSTSAAWRAVAIMAASGSMPIVVPENRASGIVSRARAAAEVEDARGVPPSPVSRASRSTRRYGIRRPPGDVVGDRGGEASSGSKGRDARHA